MIGCQIWEDYVWISVIYYLKLAHVSSFEASFGSVISPRVEPEHLKSLNIYK